MDRNIGVQTVRIDLPFRLNHVNCFIGEGENGWIVMDTGLHNENSRKTWERELQNKRVSEMIITHYHPDHYGYAGRLQQLTGAKLSMSATDARTAAQTWTENTLKRLQNSFTMSGIPQEMVTRMTNNAASFVELVTPHPVIDTYLEEGDKLVFGQHEYEVIYTPGHSDGIICLFNREQRILFSTDHILPKITPNITYDDSREENPLHTYFQSLEKVKQLNAEYVIPSHGQPFYDANKRIQEILQHHELRLEKIVDLMAHPVSAYEVCFALFGDRLTEHEMRFAIGETLAHLEYLIHQQQCMKELTDDQWTYRRI